MLNKGVILSNLQKTKDKTVVVMGVARSGTTMAAQVVQDLGVDMGSEKSGVVNERRDVFELLEKKKLKEFENFVKMQNSKHDMWGWKRPKSMEYVELFESRIRNPHYIIPFRDYVSIAVRNNLAIDLDPMKNIVDTHVDRYSKVIEFIKYNKNPMLLFSYEKAVMYPWHFVNQVAKYLGVSEKEKIRKAVKSIDSVNNSYIKHNNYLGNLDLVKEGRVSGWVKKRNSDKTINLKLMINDKFVKNIIANKPRKDLSKIGNYAFSISFSEINLVAGDKYKVSVCDIQGNHIKNSPTMYDHK